jgi:hypothetical protein
MAALLSRWLVESAVRFVRQASVAAAQLLHRVPIALRASAGDYTEAVGARCPTTPGTRSTVAVGNVDNRNVTAGVQQCVIYRGQFRRLDDHGVCLLLAFVQDAFVTRSAAAPDTASMSCCNACVP